MTTQSQADTHPLVIHLRQGNRHTLRAAWWISQIGSPPVLGLVGLILPGSVLGWEQVWLPVLLFGSLTLLLPLGYVLWLLYQGQVSDYHLTHREERFQPMMVSMGTALVGWLYLSQMQAPALLLALALANLAQTATCFLITLRWKVSIHSAVAAGLAVLAGTVAGGTVWPLVLAVPLIAWSRVVLRRHTLAQVVAGAAIGSLFLASALIIYGV